MPALAVTARLFDRLKLDIAECVIWDFLFSARRASAVSSVCLNLWTAARERMRSARAAMQDSRIASAA
jgi:hypothetical protein